MSRRRLEAHQMDLTIAVGVAVLVVADAATAINVQGPRGVNMVVLAQPSLALVWRRTHPLWPVIALAIFYTIAGVWLTPITDLSATILPALIASYAIGRYANDMRVPIALLAATVTAINVLHGHSSADDWIYPTFVFGAGIGAGRGLRTRAALAAELAERTERLAVEHELRAAEAAVEERRRIARELHDVVAHTLSVMVVQAGGARRQLGRDQQRSAEALATVEDTGRAALGELRRMLGFVSEGSGISGTGASGTSPAPRDPQPTLGDILGLARRASAAGLPTTFSVEGDPGDGAVPLAAGAEVAIFRIAQEALTNALKHAGPGASAAVTLRWSAQALEVEICDDGAGTSEGQPLPSGGHGLIGMRERVALYGGELEAGPRPAGRGFRVAVRLPRTTVSGAAAAGAQVPA